jgi:hypothetical protein
LADGLGFARGLDARTLTGEARAEIVLARARFAVRDGRVVPRRGFFAGGATLRHPRRLLLVARAPGVGIGHLQLGRRER